MTKLNANALVRETHVLERTSPIVIELHPRALVIRLKETHGSSHAIPYDVLLEFARRRTANTTRATAASASRRRS